MWATDYAAGHAACASDGLYRADDAPAGASLVHEMGGHFNELQRAKA